MNYAISLKHDFDSKWVILQNYLTFFAFIHHTSKICVSLMEWILIYFFVIYDLKCNMLFRSLLNLKQLDVYLAIRSSRLLNYNIWNQYVFILLFSLLGDVVIPEVIVVHHNFSMSSISSVILIEFFIKIIAFNSLSILWGQGIRKVRRIKHFRRYSGFSFKL